MANHPELEAEQAYIDHAFDSLERAKRIAASIREGVVDGQGGTFQNRYERDVVWERVGVRLHQLEIGDRSLVFGRIDTEPGAEDDEGRTYYIGRLAVADEHNDPVVVDWRAPLAESFYRATGVDPMGLRRRRHFAEQGPGAARHRRRAVRHGDRRPRRRHGPGPRGADRGARGVPLRQALRHRRHDPGRTGPDHPLRAAGGAGGPGRSRHRQDRRRAAPCGLPAVLAPVPARGPGRARGGPQPCLPVVHRAGAALTRRSGCADRRARRPRAQRAHRGQRSRRGGPGQGRPADDPGDPPRRARTASVRCARRCGFPTACSG